MVGHENLDCQAPVRCVNCKQEHPSYSKNCEKWKAEKEIQTVRTKQNISYSEARKIVESRTPTVGTSYAAATQNLNKKTYRTVETQTDLPINNISKMQNFGENINKTPIKLPKTQKSSQSNS